VWAKKSLKCDWPTYLVLNEDTTTLHEVDMGRMKFNPGSNIINNPQYFNLSYIDTNSNSYFYMQNRKDGFSLYSEKEIINVSYYERGNVNQIIIQNWPSCVMEEAWFDTIGNMGSKYHCDYDTIGDCYLNRYENGKLKYVDYFAPISMLPPDSVPAEALMNEFRAVQVKSGYYDKNGIFHYR
jgi:hypothetical protein